MNESYDSEFANAVRKCASTLRPIRNKQGEYKDGDSLANLLRSNMQLKKGERELLALLLSGELQRPQGKQKVGVGTPHIVETVTYFKRRRKSGDPEKVALDKAQKFLKEKHNKKIGNSQLRAWVAETEKRESMIPK